jgi:hypothetical protein
MNGTLSTLSRLAALVSTTAGCTDTDRNAILFRSGFENATTIEDDSWAEDPSGHATSHGPYHKIGLYKPGWKTGTSLVSEREVWYDEYRTGDSSATYGEISPGNP